MWEVEYTDDFEDWWNTLAEEEWIDIDACVGLLKNTALILDTRFHLVLMAQNTLTCENLEYNMQGNHIVYFMLLTQDVSLSRRVAILLIGGNKTGKDRWYEKFVPVADKLYDQHLNILKKEGLTND